MNKQIQFDYVMTHQIVEEYELEISASTLHGIITGSACTMGLNCETIDYLSLIKPYQALKSEQLIQLSDSLNLYFDETVQLLDGQMFEFEVVLPDDQASPQLRTEELAAWCRGFLTAYRHIVKKDDVLSEDAAEALQDLTQITLAETGEGEMDELEAALAELEEYLRISVQLIFDDLNPTKTVH